MKFLLPLLLCFSLFTGYAQTTRIMVVAFPDNYPDLLESERSAIIDFLNTLKGNRVVSFKIKSYCNEERKEVYNVALAVRRAREVYNFVDATKKVPNSTLSFEAYGRIDGGEKNLTELLVMLEPKEVLQSKPVAKKVSNSTINREQLLAGKNIRLNLHFYPGERELLPESLPFVKDLERFLKENPEIKIEIQGHVCCHNNEELSIQRASEVYEQLVSMGIEASRLTYAGYGNTHPAVEESTEYNRELNRRVEIKVRK